MDISNYSDLVVDSLSSEVSINPEPFEDTLNRFLIKAIEFGLHRQGDNRELISISGSIIDVLEGNSITYREIRTPSDFTTACASVLLVKDAVSCEPYLIFRDWGKISIYNPYTNSTESIGRKERDYAVLAYEIYPKFPTKVSNPLILLHFALKGNYSLIFNVLISSIIVSGFNLATPLLTSFLVGSILPKSDLGLLFETSAVVLIISLISCVFQYYSSIVLIRTENIVNIRMEISLWNHAIRLPIDFLNKFGPVDLISRVMGIRQIRQLLSNGILTGFLGSIFACSNAYLMYIYFPELTLPALITTGSLLIVSSILLVLSIRIEMPYQQKEAELGDLSLQNVIGHPQIRTFGAEPFVMRRWLIKIKELANLMTTANLYDDFIELTSSLLMPISSMVIFVILINQLHGVNQTELQTFSGMGQTSRISQLSFNQIVASFVAFQAAYLALNSQLSLLLQTVSQNLSQLLVHWKRSSDLLREEPEKDIENGSLIIDLNGSYSISGLTYRFPNKDQPVLYNLNFNIAPGTFTAITGPSGCGKTTLVRILLGLIKAESGSITIDGIEIEKLSLRQYRRQLGVVLQNSPLPAGTIYEIIRAGRDVSRSQVLQAIKLAAFEKDLSVMPMGLETIISEGGGGISGGQKQRLNIARALVGDPKVLIFDEATSALDNKTQAQITDVLQSLGMTRIVIAHRISTIREADQIIVINGGKITETGTYNELSNCKDSFLSKTLQV